MCYGVDSNVKVKIVIISKKQRQHTTTAALKTKKGVRYGEVGVSFDIFLGRGGGGCKMFT